MITAFTFKPNVYAGRFYFWFGEWDAPEIRAWYLGRGPDDKNGYLSDESLADGDAYDGQCRYPCPAHPLVLLKHVPRTPEDLGCLAHELTHAVNHFLGDLGMIPSWQSEEAYTYLMGVLTEAVLEFVWHGNRRLGIEL